MTLVVKIYDLASEELADISGIALEATWTPRHNRVSSFVIQAPAGHALLTAIADDGYRVLRKGNRKLLAWEDGDIIFHGRIFNVERHGDGTRNIATITAHDAFAELGYDSEDRAGRPVRDDTGNLINPTFVSSVGGQDEISGPDLIKQALTNSQAAPPLGEGPLPIDLEEGDFDLDVPPAIDLTPTGSMDWPILIGDFLAMLVETGVVDVRMRPLDIGEVDNPYHMVSLSAVSAFGTDRTATVHFDYWTGSKNAMECRHVEDFSTINNKLFDYVGPRLDEQHWRGLIAPDSPGVTVDVDPSRELYGGPPGAEEFGAFMSIRVLDIAGVDKDLPLGGQPGYALAIALFNAEQGYRVEPADMLFITPSPGSKALFTAPADFDLGDLITINVGADFGIALAQAQRVYGWTKTWTREGVARMSELLTSADVA